MILIPSDPPPVFLRVADLNFILPYDQTIYDTAVADGIPDTLALFMVAQARHETGNYTSRFFTIGKNAFGYSYVPGAKWQLDLGGPNADNGVPIAQYASVQNSVHELTDWIRRRQAGGIFPQNLSNITTPQEYARLLKAAGYYQDTLQNYTNGLVNWLQQIGSNLFSAKGTTITAIIIILLVAFRKKLFPK